MPKVQIAISADMDYLRPALVAMMSVLDNTRSPVTVHFLGDCLSDEAKLSVQSACGLFPGTTLRYIETSEVLAPPPSWVVEPRSMIAITALPKIITGRVLYLDCDTMTFSDIKPLFEMDMQGNSIAAIRDFVFLNMYVKNMSTFKERHDFNASLMSPYPVYDYFNSGVVLFDMDMIRENSALLGTMTDAQGLYELGDADQSWLNHVFRGRVAYLHPSWNCMWGRGRKMVEIGRSALPAEHVHKYAPAAINHYFGIIKPKPWHGMGSVYFRNPAKFAKYGYEALRYRNMSRRLLGRLAGNRS